MKKGDIYKKADGRMFIVDNVKDGIITEHLATPQELEKSVKKQGKKKSEDMQGSEEDKQESKSPESALESDKDAEE